MMWIILLIISNTILVSDFSGLSGNRFYRERNYMQDTTSDQIIVDSDYNIAEALKGIEVPQSIKKDLVILDVQYFSFDNKLHQGQLVIHKDLAEDLTKIFKSIKQKKFPVAKVIPIVHYEWNDEKSMEDNNTSSFNYRFIAGTEKLSNHSFGTAIDINPMLNPYIRKDLHQPAGSEYHPERPGTITMNSFLVKEFKDLGWEWGGYWKDRKDYQHFEKSVK